MYRFDQMVLLSSARRMAETFGVHFTSVPPSVCVSVCSSVRSYSTLTRIILADFKETYDKFLSTMFWKSLKISPDHCFEKSNAS